MKRCVELRSDFAGVLNLQPSTFSVLSAQMQRLGAVTSWVWGFDLRLQCLGLLVPVTYAVQFVGHLRRSCLLLPLGHVQSLFEEHMKPHRDQAAIIRQNLAAQENILL